MLTAHLWKRTDWILLWHTLHQPCQWETIQLCQYSTNAIETISSKHCLESLAQQEGISITKYHADNGVFSLNEFKEDCASLDQRYLFSGVGAHHQNGIAEQNIKTVSQWPVPTCYILLTIGLQKQMSASGHRQLIMLYGFSTACLIL